MIISLTACSDYGYIPKDTTTDSLQAGSQIVQQNDDGTTTVVTVAGTSTLTHNIPVEDFTFQITYDLGKYSLEKWRITDSKSIIIKAKTQDAVGKEVLVEHLHADINIKSTDSDINGITQDSMDDSYHGYSQDGFYINDLYDYQEIFAIEGYSEHRITESRLLNNGVYAQKLTVVFNLLIKNDGDSKYHTVAVTDEVLIEVKRNSN